jgi:hypothetical protein
LRDSKNFRIASSPVAMDSLLSMLGFGRGAAASSSAPPHPIAQGPDDDVPAAGGNALACFGAGCFWGVELAFQRVPGVTKTEVGYTQGNTHMPTYEDVCGGRTGVFQQRWDNAFWFSITFWKGWFNCVQCELRGARNFHMCTYVRGACNFTSQRSGVLTLVFVVILTINTRLWNRNSKKLSVISGCGRGFVYLCAEFGSV